MKFIIGMFLTVLTTLASADFKVYENLASENIYSDCKTKGDACSVEDPAKKEATITFRQGFLNQIEMIGKNSDKFYFESNAVAGEEVKQWFVQYVAKNGLLKPVEQSYSNQEIYQNWYEIRWALNSICLAYYKTQSLYSKEEQTSIERWIADLVNASIYSKYTYGSKDFRMQLNNHYYSTALALFSAGFVTHSSRMIRDAKFAINTAINHINDDGLFPNEIQRKSKSAHYQSLSTSMIVVALHVASLSDPEWANETIKDKQLIRAEYASVKMFTDDDFHKQMTGGFAADRHHNKAQCTSWTFPYLQLSTDGVLKESMSTEMKWFYEGCDYNYIIGGNPELLRTKLFKIE